ncbi:MAG: hypothetical protein QOG99_1259 [Frankiales bacterium]|jgi:hypothetical protein|nr:hypothetical protein [Frankiales bacterium]
MPITRNERSQLEHVEQELQRLFAAVPPTRVHDEVQAGLRRFEGARVRAFVPVLVAKRAKDHLRTLDPDRSGPSS